MKIEKAIAISDAKIQFVSLVDKAANKRRFLITKANDGQAQFSTTGKILKVDESSHYITGIVYEPLVEDAHGNYMTEDEIRKSAYWFAKNSDKVDLQHSFEQVDGVSVVENYVAPSDMTIADQPIVKGTWVMTVEVNNADVWSKVQKGEVTGFSMGGVGKYSETETELPETAEKRGVFKKLANLLGFDVVEKSGRKISGKNRGTLQTIYDNLGKLLEECSENDKEETELTKAEVQALVDESVKKALEIKKASEKEEEKKDTEQKGAAEKKEPPAEKPEITMETVREMVNEAVKRALKPEEKTLKAEDIKAMVSEAVTKAVEPILKARGVSSNLNEETAVQKNEEPHYLAGIL